MGEQGFEWLRDHRGRELAAPEMHVSLGCRGVPAVLVTMPEAAVDEAHCVVLWKEEIRFAGQTLRVKSVPETELFAS